MLRDQAKDAVSGFLQGLLDDPGNASSVARLATQDTLAPTLWSEALLVVYRLLFLLKLESRESPAPAFIETAAWRNTYSPTTALAPIAKAHLKGEPTGRILADRLRALVRLFQHGFCLAHMESDALASSALGPSATPLLDSLVLGESAAAHLLDALLSALPDPALEVEELGHLYESLLELEPGIATEPMCRLRRRKLEVVVPLARAQRYRHRGVAPDKSQVQWIEDIPPGRFYLRVGLGRKTTGSYYTPKAIVRFLLQETLGHRVENLSPRAILELKVLDPAMGAGHFLVEACRFLGDKLYEACQRSDELRDPDCLDRARCRLLVARHCLYGVDKNPLAVELARLSLWVEAYAEGLPPSFLDHRLIHGDSLTGALLCQLRTRPTSGDALPNDDDDVETKDAQRLLAAAWSGGVMLGEPACDEAYEELVMAILARRDPDELIAARPLLARMIEIGREGVAYELAFPEVFSPLGTKKERAGFDAIVGNPPWDALQPLAREFYAAFDLGVLDAPTRLERARIEEELMADPAIRAAFECYLTRIERTKRALERGYAHVNRRAHGSGSGAITDLWQGFVERGVALLAKGGELGLVLPSAFYANQSATGIRELLFDKTELRKCFSFENRNKLFDIDSRFKFALVVARRSLVPTRAFACAFYLHELEWLFRGDAPLHYSRPFVEATGGAHLTLLELRSSRDLEVAEVCFSDAEALAALRRRLGIRIGVEIDMTKAAHLFTPTSDLLPEGEEPRRPDTAGRLLQRGQLVLHEGKTFHQYEDQWEERPRYSIASSRIAARRRVLEPARYFRLALRAIASSTNERTAIMAMLPPGVVFGNSALCEREPELRPNHRALALLAWFNTFTFDWCLRQKNGANVNLFILDTCPIPSSAFLGPRALFLAHAALRLSCNHTGYAPLFQEQLGDVWREPTREHTFPVLENPDCRSQLRAAIDALVAHTYGLSRDQYAHVLSSFSHKSHPGAPCLCLSAFQALETRGLEAFVMEHDPYSDIPLVERPPSPAIALPLVAPLPMG